MSFPEQGESFRLADMTRPQQLGHPSTWPAAQQPAAPPRPVHAARRSRPIVWILAAVGALVLLGGGVGGYLVAFAPITVKGTVTVANAGQGFSTTECRGTGGYSDLAGGASVTITDASGKTIAIGRLEPGRVSGANCVFAFSVDAPHSDFYGIEVSHRGVVKASRAEAQAGVALGIG